MTNVAGHLREQNGMYQMILSWKDTDGKRRTKSISTGLPVKGNKKRAESLLRKTQKEFNPETINARSRINCFSSLINILNMDGESLMESKIQNDIIAYVKEVTPQFSVMQIYSDDRAGVNTAITNYLNEKLTAEYGINVSSALIVDAQPDDTLMQKIRAKEQAKQDAEIAELNKQTALAQAETDKVKAQTEADVKMIEAQAEADANKVLSESITPELIQMKEAEARLKHGWITVQGADTVVTKGE